jgi:hypothetical protein
VPSYSTVTWLLPSGRSHGSTFFLAACSACAARELVRVGDGRGHQLGGLVAGVAEHHALVAGALLLVHALPGGDALGDIRETDGAKHQEAIDGRAPRG